MDHLTLDRLIFLTLLIVFFYSSVSVAATPVVLETGIFFAADGTMYYKTVGGTSTLMYPDLQLSKDVPVNTSKGLQLLTVARTPKIDLSRMGAAAVNFAKLLGPIGLGVQVAQIVCDLSKICSNASGLWEKQADLAVAGYPATLTGQAYWWTGQSGGWSYDPTPNDGVHKYPSPEILCTDIIRWENSCSPAACGGTQKPVADMTVTSVTSTTANCNYRSARRDASYPTGEPTTRAMSRVVGACPANYTASAGNCVLTGSGTAHTPADSDWAAAKSLLNDLRFVQPLLDKGEAVPVFAPPPVPMIEKVIDTHTVPTFDSSGNVTGSQVTTTKLQATDASTPSSPNTFNITESTTINNYNTSNVLTSTTTTVVNPPAPAPPAADPTTFDEVPDVPVQTKAINPDYDATSWGEGACPAPVTITTQLFGSHVIPTATACDFAVAVKPIIILLATITAIFIMSGAKTEG